MPFWGIEVKPWKSHAYSSDSARRKLRITQASIGRGISNARCTLQINVGDKKPIILCNLLPNVCENFNMELEFEESEDVLFSVLGERSVHLAGYLIDSPDCKLDGNDSDSIGEDIAHTESSGSYGDDTDLDKYESDFIDDEDEITNLPSPRSTSEELQETSYRRRLKKTYQLSDSDDYKVQVGTKSNSIFNLESDDSDDSLLVSTFKKKKSERKKSNANVSLNADNPRVVVGDAKETVHVSESSPSMETKIVQESNEKKKKKKKKKNKEEKAIAVSPLVVEEHQNLSAVPDKNEHDETGKRKKGKKQKETSEVDETGIVEQHQNLTVVPDGKKGKMQKESSEVDETGIVEEHQNLSVVPDGKTGKMQKEPSEVDETGIVEEHQNLSVVPDGKKGKMQKEPSEVDETGIVEEHQNLNTVPDKKERDETGKRNKAKKQKETSEVDSTDKIVNNPLVSKDAYSENDGVGKKRRKAKKHKETIENKMDENSLVIKATDSEVSPSDTTQQNARNVSKRSKKRTKDERCCDPAVADVNYSDAKKLKEENSRNDNIN